MKPLGVQTIDVLKSARDGLLLNGLYLRTHREAIEQALDRRWIELVTQDVTSAGRFEKYALTKSGKAILNGEEIDFISFDEVEEVSPEFFEKIKVNPNPTYLCPPDEAW